MKVIQYVSSIDHNSGGTAVYIKLLANQMKHALDLTVLTGKSLNPILLTDVKTVFIDFNLRRWFKIKREFISILRNIKPDLVHINGIWEPQNWLLQIIAQRMGIKVLLSPHGMLEPYILKRNPLKKKIAMILYQNKALLKANYLHATAISEMEQFKKLGYNLPIEVIPNGIDMADIKFNEKVAAKPTHKNILFLSRIHPKKGIELLIEAVYKLKDKNVKVIIAGEGEQKYIDELVALILEKKLNEQIIFLGGVYGEDKWDLFNQADLFVLPTYSENFGLVVIEALAVGVPVITTTGTPWKELDTYNCGWWIELSIQNLTNAIEEAFLKTSTELKEMGERGKALVERKYDIRAVSNQTFELYHTIVQN